MAEKRTCPACGFPIIRALPEGAKAPANVATHWRNCEPKKNWPDYMRRRPIAVSGGAAALGSRDLPNGQELDRSQPPETDFGGKFHIGVVADVTAATYAKPTVPDCECGWSGKDIAKHRARAAVHREVTA